MKKAKKTQNSGDKNARSLDHSSKRTKIILLIVIILVVVGGGVTGFFIWRNSVLHQSDMGTHIPLSPEQAKAVKQTGQTLDPKIAASANTAKSQGDASASVEVYDKAIAANSDKDEQVALYTNKAVLQASNGDFAGAIESAKKAEELAGETLGTTSLLASLYKQSGDKANAALYFRKAAALVVDNGDGSMVGQKQYYLDTAAQLEASK